LTTYKKICLRKRRVFLYMPFNIYLTFLYGLVCVVRWRCSRIFIFDNKRWRKKNTLSTCLLMVIVPKNFKKTLKGWSYKIREACFWFSWIEPRSLILLDYVLFLVSYSYWTFKMASVRVRFIHGFLSGEGFSAEQFAWCSFQLEHLQIQSLRKFMLLREIQG
jgi:hypothetical protein